MMRNLKYMAAFAAAVLFAVLPVACTDDPDEQAEQAEPAELTEQSGDQPVRFDVKSVTSSSDASRVAIGSTTSRPTNPDHPEFYAALKEVCAVPASGSRDERFAIGLFGDYTYVKNAGTASEEKVTVYDFYRGDRLVYLPPKNEEEEGSWDTNTVMKYWHPDALYIFRAYYPQRLYNYTVSTSNATTLALVYPSRKLQYDLLLAVNEVPATDNTYNDDGTVNVVGQMHKPVELEFKHALAALRFQFRLNFEDADFLTSVYLLNDEERHYFSQGTVVFGGEIDPKTDLKEVDIKSIEWLQDYNPPADEILYKWVPPLKYWYGEDLDGDGKIEMGGKDLDGDGVIEKGGRDLNGNGIFEENEIRIGRVVNNGKTEYETEEMYAEYMAAKWGWDNINRKINRAVSVDPDGALDPIPVSHVSSDKFNPVLMYSYVEDEQAKNTEGGGISAQDILYKSKYANSYYGTELYYDITKDPYQWVSRTPPANPKEIDRYASEEADEVAAEGALYCRNSGWLLIPPQQSFGELTLCFTTKKGGGTIYKVKLPVKTGTEIDKNGDVIVDNQGKPVTGAKDANGNLLGTPVWAAGYRYTYWVTISESDYTINVTIQDWNERKHSTEIIF